MKVRRSLADQRQNSLNDVDDKFTQKLEKFQQVIVWTQLHNLGEDETNYVDRTMNDCYMLSILIHYHHGILNTPSPVKGD